MPGRLFEIRYPDNYFEFDARTGAPPPKVGDTLRRRGRLWKVTSRTDDIPVIVEVAPAEERRKTSSEQMPAQHETPRKSILRLRFPDGEVEIRWTDEEVPVGVLVRSRGALWVVKSSSNAAIDLAPAPPEVQAQHGPMVKPSPLGEDEVLLEAIIDA